MATTRIEDQPQAKTAAPAIDWDDVQGIVLRGYGKHRFSANLFVRIDDAPQARGWLAAALHRVTTADRATARVDQCYFNIAFTRTGLEKLGLTGKSLTTFPTAFFEGMASATRSRILGDLGPSEPGRWYWGGPGKEVDAMILLFGADEATRDEALAAELAGLKGLAPLVEPLLTHLPDDEREHFGFHDGVSQPVIEGSPPPLHSNMCRASEGAYGPSNVIKAGEFLLGQINEYGVHPDPLNLPPAADPALILPTVELPDGSVVPDLGRNGTYLAVRQLEQHVPQFWTYLDAATKDGAGVSNPEECARLASKLVGRWPSGAPTALAPQWDDPNLGDENDFLYKASDPEGMGCPFGSHIRRSNPRDTLGDDPAEALKLAKGHRLIRRARSYGPKVANNLDLSDTRERGLMFIAINANIERQFEFIQQTWINGPSFNGLYDERDPLCGSSPDGKLRTMTIPRTPVRRRLQGIGAFVTVRGGAYFFLPAIKALRYLSQVP